MASIMTTIELADRVSGPLLNITNALNMTVSAFETMQTVSANEIDTNTLQGARENINEATIAIQQMRQELGNLANAPPPPTWNVQPSTTIFQSSGIERYRQEIQSANTMLGRLYTSQQQIQNTANNVVFPNHITNDITRMNTRISDIRTQLERISNQNIDRIGADRVNNQIETLRIQLNQALQSQEHLSTAMQRMDITSANRSYNQLNSILDSAERNIRDNINGQNQFNASINNGVANSNNLFNGLKRVVSIYTLIKGVKLITDTSDTLTTTAARLNMLNDGLQTSKDLQNMIYLAAERSRTSYSSMADVVAKVGLRAKDSFSSNTQTIAFAETLNKMFVVAGASQQEISSASLQLTQALGSGVLKGEEFNAVFEAAPNVMQSIADYMNQPIGKLREMAKDGKITANIVKNAILAAAEETNEAFNNMPMTFGQIMISIKNRALKEFEPVLNRLNSIINSDGFDTFINGVTNALVFLAGVATEVFNVITNISSFMSENWSILKPVILGVAGALIIYNAYLRITNTILKVFNAIKAISISRMALMVLGIMAIIAIIYIVISAINKATNTTTSATGVILGSVYAIGAGVYNIFLGILEFVFACINAIINTFTSFANFMSNFLVDPIASIIYLFRDLADGVLGIIEGIASAIDFVFGSNLASSVGGWRNSVSNLADSLANEFGNGKYQEIEKKVNLSVEGLGLERWDYLDAYSKGYETGKGIEDSLANLSDLFGFESNIPDPNDYIYDIEETASNTGDIKDSLEINKEDLKYLRDIAEREVINRFTTAEIKVDMVNNNTMNSKVDMDGIVEHLKTKMEKEMIATAEGVY